MKKNKKIWIIGIIVLVLLGVYAISSSTFHPVLKAKIPVDNVTKIIIQKESGPYTLDMDRSEITEPGQITETYQRLSDISILKWIYRGSYSVSGGKEVYYVQVIGEKEQVYIRFMPSSFWWYYLIIDNKEYICWE